MTSLKDSLDTEELQNQLLNLTNDLPEVFGLRALSPTSAEIWVSSAAAKAKVVARANQHEELADVSFTFREELDEAYSPGGASDRPRTWEPKDDDRAYAEDDPSSAREMDE